MKQEPKMEMDRLDLSQFGRVVSEQSFDPVAFARMKAEQENKKTGNLEGYDCPVCLNRGRIYVPKDDGKVIPEDCRCMKVRRCVQKMEASGLRDVIRECTFDHFKDTEQWQTTIKNGAKAYAENPEGWLLFCGQSGSGKTHLCTAVCRHLLLNGEEVRYMPWRQDAEIIKDKKSATTRGSELKESMKTAPILFIDDLFKTGRGADGTCVPTIADVNLAFDIVNYRYTKRLPTIISTEKTPLELVEIDEAVGGRIVEMSGKNVFQIAKKPGRNYRLRNIVTV